MVPRLLTALPTPGRWRYLPLLLVEEMITVEELTEDAAASSPLTVASTSVHH
jgi:hypothetical protein